MLVWRRFSVPLFPICVPLFPFRVPLVPICVTLSTSSPYEHSLPLPTPISRYFCKDSLMTPLQPPQHTTPLQASLLLPPLTRSITLSKKFHCTIFFIFYSCSFMFICVPFVLTRVHSCLLLFTRVTRVYSCSLVFTRVHSCSLVFIRVHSYSFRVHSCSFVFIRVHSCSFVFIRVHSCPLVFIRVPFVFRSVWCFRYDRQMHDGGQSDSV